MEFEDDYIDDMQYENDGKSISRIYTISDENSEYNEQKDFITLKAWQDCRLVKKFFYEKILNRIPTLERYNLDSQIRRACISTTANIAEGYGRFHYQEGIQFYRISRSSLYELKDHLISCKDFGYIDENLFNEGETLIETAKISLNGYIRYNLKKNK